MLRHMHRCMARHTRRGRGGVTYVKHWPNEYSVMTPRLSWHVLLLSHHEQPDEEQLLLSVYDQHPTARHVAVVVVVVGAKHEPWSLKLNTHPSDDPTSLHSAQLPRYAEHGCEHEAVCPSEGSSVPFGLHCVTLAPTHLQSTRDGGGRAMQSGQKGFRWQGSHACGRGTELTAEIHVV
jgi:hypothetical protein